MREKIEKILNKATEYLSLEDICFRVGATTEEEKQEVSDYVSEALFNYDINEQDGKFMLMRKTSMRKGIFQTKKDRNIVVVGEQEFTIEDKDRGNAIDGDEVLINIPYLEKVKKISKRKKKQQKLNEVSVEKIIDRDLSFVVGQVYQKDGEYYLRPDDRQMRNLKFILPGNDYTPGEKLFVRANQDEEALQTGIYHATVQDRIGFKGEPETDIELEAYKLGIYKGFSKETLSEVEKVPVVVREEDKIGKADLTNWEIFTIDGDDTKDIDDAISLYEDENGNIVLGVHIAYPAYYIERGSSTYNEALYKGTSCYPTSSRVFPMLHPKLSNGICSLNPQVERLAVSYVMTFDKNANLVDYDIFESVIKSDIQMTYKKVNDLLERGIVHEGYEKHKDTLLRMKEFSDKLREKRLARGALMFETEELKISLDDDGKVSSIGKRSTTTSDKIIESFMVASAEAYASFCQKNGIPCVYRNHDIPFQFKMNKYLELLRTLGIDYKEKVKVSNPLSIQKLAKFVSSEDDMSQVLITRFIRCLKKADYGVNNIGHSGLASKGHCPNTSPMRRGPDFVGQFALKEMVLDRINSQEIADKIESRIPALKKKTVTNLNVSSNMLNYKDENLVLVKDNWNKEISSLTSHLSKTEVNANTCEREVNKMKIAQKMSEEIGKEYSGLIINLDSRYIYVQLDNLVEGRVQLKDLPGNARFQSKANYVKSQDGDNYYIGDRVTVVVKHANEHRKTVDFDIREKERENTKCKEKVLKREAEPTRRNKRKK